MKTLLSCQHELYMEKIARERGSTIVGADYGGIGAQDQ